MKAKSIFGIIVRTIGLLVAIHALSNLQTLFVMSDGFGRVGISRGGFVVGILLEFWLGLGLLFFARGVLRLAYHRPMKSAARPMRSTRQPRRALAAGRRQPKMPNFENLDADELAPEEPIPD